MSNYTGLLTGNYYFQLNTGNGFLEATNDKTINVGDINTCSYSYPHGLKRESIDDLLGDGQTGFCSEFAIGANILRITKGNCELYGGAFSNDNTRCIVWDEYNNFLVGTSASNVVANGACNSVAIGATNTLCSVQNSRILGNSSSICNANDSTILGYSNTVNGGWGIFINGNNNTSSQTQDGVIFQYNNTSNGGYGNFINGNNNVVCSQYGHFNATILAGSNNEVYGALNTILGGQFGKIGADAGQVNETYENYSLIGNGLCNYILGSNSTIINGRCNRNIGHNNFIGGGFQNCINVTDYDLFNNPGQFDSIQNIIPLGNFIGNGYYNKILDTAQSSLIVGGKQNIIKSGIYSSILGGFNNSIENAPNSFIIGSRGHIASGLGGVLGGISGVGIITDGSVPVFANVSNTLVVNADKGIDLRPGINIYSNPYGNRNELDLVLGRSGYNYYYTGINYPTRILNATKIINIGTFNRVKAYTDISGQQTGSDSLLDPYVFNRSYNPSTVLGHYNLVGHLGIALGYGNMSNYESYETAVSGYARYSGFYNYIEAQITGTGYFLTGIATINGGPWWNYEESFPTYQGLNTLIGNFNHTTGMNNIIIGNNNFTTNAKYNILMLGQGNSIVPPDWTVLSGSNGFVSGITRGTGLYPFLENSMQIGFANWNNDGRFSIDIGMQNSNKTYASTTLGRSSQASGTSLVSIGNILSNQGIGGTNVGIGNLLLGESGFYNNIFGYNNISTFFGSGNTNSTSNNQIFGGVNFIRGNNNLSLGYQNSIETVASGLFGYTILSTAIGFYNTILNSFNTTVGQYNRTSGLSNYVFGQNNNAIGLENLSLGIYNNNYGKRSAILGNVNAAYGVNNTIIGNQGYAVNSNQISLGGGDGLASWPGSSQKNYLFWKGVTSGTTRSELMLDGVNAASNDYISGKAFIHSGMVWNGKINIIAAETGLGNIFTQERYVTVANKNNTIHIISNQLISSSTSGTAAWGITLSGDNTNKAICINATGEAAKFIYWNIVGEFNQVFAPTNETVYRKEYSNNEISTTLLKSGNNLWDTNIDPNIVPSAWQDYQKYYR